MIPAERWLAFLDCFPYTWCSSKGFRWVVSLNVHNIIRSVLQMRKPIHNKAKNLPKVTQSTRGFKLTSGSALLTSGFLQGVLYRSQEGSGLSLPGNEEASNMCPTVWAPEHVTDSVRRSRRGPLDSAWAMTSAGPQA